MSRRRAVVLVIVGVLRTAAVPAAEPAKDASTRRGFDFTRPEPGAILPNPTEGVGTPPQLREYVTVPAMMNEATQAGAGASEKPEALGKIGPPAPSSTGNGTRSTPPQRAPPPLQQSAGQAAQRTAGNANPASAATASAKPPSDADYVQKVLAEQVSTRGIAGPFTYRPSPLAEADPALLAEEQKAWNSSVAHLASSWRTWQATHRAAPDGGAAGAPGLDAQAGISGFEAAPGRIVFSGAPAGVTGDLANPAP